MGESLLMWFCVLSDFFVVPVDGRWKVICLNTYILLFEIQSKKSMLEVRENK